MNLAISGKRYILLTLTAESHLEKSKPLQNKKCAWAKCKQSWQLHDGIPFLLPPYCMGTPFIIVVVVVVTIIITSTCVWGHVHVHTCQGTCTEVRRQFAEVGSLPPAHGTQGSSSGSQTWWQTLLPTEPFYQPPFSLTTGHKLEICLTILKDSLSRTP